MNLNGKRTQSKDKRPRSKETQKVPNISLNLSRGREDVNSSKFLFKIPSLQRPNQMAEDFKAELLQSSQKQRLARESNSSSELRHKMKNSKMLKVSDILDSEGSSSVIQAIDRDLESFVASKQKQPSKQRKLA